MCTGHRNNHSFSLLGWSRGFTLVSEDSPLVPTYQVQGWCDYMDRPRYKVWKVLKHLVNPRKAGQRNYLCTSRGVAAWLLTEFRRLWIIGCPETARAFSLRLISDLA